MFRVTTARWMRRLLAIAALAALGACDQPRPTEPLTPASALDDLALSSGKLVECPTDETIHAVGWIGEAGGTLSIGGTSVVFPAGLLTGLTKVELTIPASRYVEIDIKANDQEYSSFETPVLVTIDYSRCRRSDVLTKALMVWYIDTRTKAALENMEGVVDDKLLRRISFPTTHFSGYAIAF